MPIISKLITPLPSAAVLFGGSYYAYDNYWPKTIGEWYKKENVPKIKATKSEHYKAMYNDNFDLVSNLDIPDLTFENSGVKLKEWCKKSLDESWTRDLRRKIDTFCFYNPKTVKGWIIGSNKWEYLLGDEENNDDEDYKTNFVVFRDQLSSFLGERNISTLAATEGSKKLKRRCRERFSEKISDTATPDDFSDIFTFCSKNNNKTVEEKIKSDDKNWNVIGESDNEKWKKSFEKWKHTKEILKFLNKDLGEYEDSIRENTDKETGGPKMKQWCTKGLKKKLYDEGVYPDEYSLLKFSCIST